MKIQSIKTLVIAILVLGSSIAVNAQSANEKREKLLTSKKWTCLEVSRKKLEKMDFKMEIGNILSFRIDKKYSFQNNDYNYQAGKWKVDGTMLYFFYNAPDDNRILTARYKIQRLNEREMRLKRLDRPKGKLVFK